MKCTKRSLSGLFSVLLLAGFAAVMVFSTRGSSESPKPTVKTAADNPGLSYEEMRTISDRLDLLRVQAAPGPAHSPDVDRLYTLIANAYNAVMQNTNYRYTRASDLPPGEIYVLPRSYDPLGSTP